MGVHVVMNQKGGVGKSTLAMNLAAVKADVLIDPAGERQVGIAVGELTVLSGQHLAAAVLAGGAAFGAAVLWLDKVVDR